MVFMKELLEGLKGKNLSIYTTEQKYDYNAESAVSECYTGVLSDIICNKQQDVVAVNILTRQIDKHTIMLSAIVSININKYA